MKHKLLLLVLLTVAFAPAASAQQMAGKTLWTLFDSLGDGNQWQPLLCRLTGMEFHPELNYHLISYGGTTTEASMLNGTLPRAKLLVAQKDSLPIDVVLMENVNDINFFTPDSGTIGSMNDKPWMQGRKMRVHDGAFSSLGEAKKYVSEHMDSILGSVPDSLRAAGAMLAMPYLTPSDKGIRFSIKATPRQSGTFYITCGIYKTGIFVTPEMTASDIINRMMECFFGAGWTHIDNGDGSITFHYIYHKGRNFDVQTMDTGLEVNLEPADQSLEHILYFTGSSAEEWFEHDKWVDHISLYSTYKGLLEYLQKNLPQSRLYWVIPSYFNFDLSDPALRNADGTLNAAACRKTDIWQRWQKLKEFQLKMCKRYGIPVIDLSENCGITLSNMQTYYTSKNVHPSQAAYDLWAETIAAYFKANCYTIRSGRYMKRMSAAVQSMAVSGDYMVTFYGGGAKGSVMQLSTGRRLGDIVYESGEFSKPHGNALCFGTRKASKHSALPLLYVSQWDGEGGCLVYDITKDGDGHYKATLVQTIMYAAPDSIYGSRLGDWVLDADKNMIWACKYRLDSSVEMEQNANHFTAFRLPKYRRGSHVTLRPKDIKAHFTTKFMPIFQDKTLRNGRLYIAAGGDWIVDLACSQKIYEVDLAAGRISREFDLSCYGKEPEGLEFIDGKLNYVYGGSRQMHVIEPEADGDE